MHSALRELYLGTNEDLPIHPSELLTMLDLATFPSLEKFSYHSPTRTSFPNSAIPSIFVVNSPILTFLETSGTARQTILFLFSPTYLRSRISTCLTLIVSVWMTLIVSVWMTLSCRTCCSEGSLRSVLVNPLTSTDCFLASSHWNSADLKDFRGAALQALSAPPPWTAVQIYALLQRGWHVQIQSAAFPSNCMQRKKWNTSTHNFSFTSRALTGLEFSAVKSWEGIS